MFWNSSSTCFRMTANNRMVLARRPLSYPQATGLKSKSPYLRMELLAVNVRNSQGCKYEILPLDRYELFSKLQVQTLVHIQYVSRNWTLLNSIRTNWERFQCMSLAPCHGVISVPIKPLAKNYSPKNFTAEQRTTGQMGSDGCSVFNHMPPPPPIILVSMTDK